MGTSIRPNISESNKYWIDKHRYYELKHFCLQYPRWKKAYASICELSAAEVMINKTSNSNIPGDPTAKYAIARAHYSELIDMVDTAAIQTEPGLATYILKAVTEGVSYNYLKSRLDMPCSKDTYYDRYRRFFWILSKARN